jgi:hypothetical protein
LLPAYGGLPAGQPATSPPLVDSLIELISRLLNPFIRLLSPR